MYSPALHYLLGQAHAHELRRSTGTVNRHRAVAIPNRPETTMFAARFKRTITRAFEGSRDPMGEAATLHGIELVGRS